jgi:hypothetical protein
MDEFGRSVVWGLGLSLGSVLYQLVIGAANGGER